MVDRIGLLARSACLMGVLLVPGAGWAQAVNDRNQPSADADSSGEIIVTAQRREERARDVPISITQIGGAELQSRGITNSRDLSQLTPGLRIDRTGVATQPSLRGISTTFTTAGSDAPVAIYIDGIYQQSLQGLTFELPDVKSIEVLKGPQGSLYGRNATGGAILISTLDPEFDFGGKASASYGRFNEVALNTFVTGPLADKVAFSIDGSVHNSDGYMRDIINGQPRGALKSNSVRAKLRIEPTSDLKIMVGGFYSRRRDGSVVTQVRGGNTQAGNTLPGTIVSTTPYIISNDEDPFSRVNSYGGFLRLRQDTSVGEISAVTAYEKWDIHARFDNDGVIIPNRVGSFVDQVIKEKSFSQELNFSSRRFGAFSFIAGLLYYRGSGGLLPQTFIQDYPTTSFTQTYSVQRSNAQAIYADATYRLTDRLVATGGLRYSTEKRSLNGGVIATGAPRPAMPRLGSRRDSDITAKASLTYKLTDQSNIYISFNQGFKSGAYNTAGLVLPLQSVKPEKVNAYEIGSKSSFGGLNISLSAFYYDYSDLQTSALTVIDGRITATLQNAANARIYGSDLEATWAITHQLSLSAGVSLLDAKYSSFPNAAINVPRPGNAGNVIASMDVKGNFLTRAPKSTINLSGKYGFDLAGGDFSIAPSLYYSSHYFFEAGNRLRQHSYTLLGVRATWTTPDSRIGFSVYGNNLTNALVSQTSYPSPYADIVTYAPPRTYGVSLNYNF